jgi:oligoendopeptidase F
MYDVGRAVCAVVRRGDRPAAARRARVRGPTSVYSVTRPGVDRRGFASPAPAASPRSLLTHTHKLRTLSTLTHEGGAPGHTHTCRLSIRYAD